MKFVEGTPTIIFKVFTTGFQRSVTRFHHHGGLNTLTARPLKGEIVREDPMVPRPAPGTEDPKQHPVVCSAELLVVALYRLHAAQPYGEPRPPRTSPSGLSGRAKPWGCRTTPPDSG